MSYLKLIIINTVIALLGYGTYALYPRFSLTETTGLSLFILSIAAGFASFFSPCSFSLMVALIGRFSKSNGQISIRASLRTAISIATGASLFFIISGVIVVMGGEVLFSSVTFDSLVGRMIRLITGSILITFGLMQLGELSNRLTSVTRIASPFMRFQARHRNEMPILGLVVFGFAYPMAGFGWTGPILVGLASYATLSSGSIQSLVAIVILASTFVLLIFFVMMMIFTSQNSVIEKARNNLQHIKRVGAYVLISVGCWLILLSIFASAFTTIFSV